MSDRVRAVADAVLYEGFLLFPYRRNALKNQFPWQFGVLMPQGYADSSEPASFHAEMVLIGAGGCIEGAFRFLQPADGPIEREIPFTIELRDGHTEFPFAIDELCGAIVADVAIEGDVARLTLEARNHSSTRAEANRAEALRTAFVSAHAILTARGAVFASLLDPPEAAKAAAASCVNERVFPVLAGEQRENKQIAEAMLVSPIILYDFPVIAKQSRGHTFD